MIDKQSDNFSNTMRSEFLAAYDEYAEKIYKHIFFRVNNKELAEDMTSETFLKAWNYIAEGDPTGAEAMAGKVKNFRSFLYRIAHNMIVDHYRQKSHAALSLDALQETEGNKIEPVAEFKENTTIDLETLKKQIDRLPENYKEMIVMRYIDDLDINEIRKITGKSFANIYVTIHRGLKMLKKEMER
jgi:RNA polymerase sigma-70 factor (ECF subfamily)